MLPEREKFGSLCGNVYFCGSLLLSVTGGFQRSILDEFYRVAFRKKIYVTLEELQKDLDDWIDDYNIKRPHQGKSCRGKTPMETFLKNVLLAKEKILDMREDELTTAT